MAGGIDHWHKAGQRWAQGSGAIVCVAVALFAAIAALRFAYPAPGDAVGVLFVVPIVVVATRFGVRGGLAAGLVALGLVAATSSGSVGVVGYATRAAAFLLVGAVQGSLSEHLAQSRHAEAQLLESSPAAIVEADATGRVVFANDAALRLLGYPRDALVGSPIELVVPQRLRDQNQQLREDYLAKPQFRTVSRFELSVRRRDGTEIPVAISLAPLASASGVRARITITDIGERLEMQQALRETAQTLENIVDNTTAIIVLTDVDGRYLMVNRQWERVFGSSRQDVKGKTVHDLLEPDLANTIAANDATVLETRTTGDFEEVVPLDDGPHTYLSVRFPLAHTGGSPFGVGAVSTDITRQKRVQEELRSAQCELERANAELEHSNTELEQFASIAAHDLQEPLRTVAGFARLLQRSHDDRLDEEGREYVSFIVEGASRMQHLIEDLLAYCRVGRQELRLEPVDSNAVVEEVKLSLAHAIEDADADIVVASLPVVRADERQLAQVLQNLVYNAIKFRGPEPPRIEISVAQLRDQWVFSVVDNGIGIDPQYGARIFEVFQRLHTREQYEGTGMGLAVCQRIIDRHGGRIWFEPRLDGGSVFCFTLPNQETAIRV